MSYDIKEPLLEQAIYTSKEVRITRWFITFAFLSLAIRGVFDMLPFCEKGVPNSCTSKEVIYPLIAIGCLVQIITLYLFLFGTPKFRQFLKMLLETYWLKLSSFEYSSGIYFIVIPVSFLLSYTKSEGIEHENWKRGSRMDFTLAAVIFTVNTIGYAVFAIDLAKIINYLEVTDIN